jgi:hypothetical protein
MSVAPATSQIRTPAGGAIIPATRHDPSQRGQPHITIDTDPGTAAQLNHWG